MRGVKGSALSRFWQQVCKTESCWLWTGHTKSRGKGLIWVDGKPVYASRFSYQQFVGEIPKGMYVCHSCDNPVCVNPDHLFVGTQDDNMKDMKLKGRSNHPIGSMNGRAKVTEDDVRFIRKNYKPRHPEYGQKALALRFGMTTGAIQEILYRNKWTHVQD